MHKKKNPLDIETFHSVAGDRVEVKTELLELFLMNVSECIHVIEVSMQSNDNTKWRYGIEDLRSISSRLGAKDLATVCSSALEQQQLSDDVKQNVVRKIRIELENLQVYVRKTGY